MKSRKRKTEEKFIAVINWKKVCCSIVFDSNGIHRAFFVLAKWQWSRLFVAGRRNQKKKYNERDVPHILIGRMAKTRNIQNQYEKKKSYKKHQLNEQQAIKIKCIFGISLYFQFICDDLFKAYSQVIKCK